MKRRENKKKVLMAASVASMIDQFNMQNIRLLIELGYEVHVACNFKEGNTCDARRIKEMKKMLNKMQVVWMQWDCPRSIFAVKKCVKAYWQLWELTGRYSYEWIHCHSPIGGALARIVAGRRKIRVIYTAHGFHFYKGAPLRNWLLFYPAEKILAHWTDVLITVNKEDYWIAKKCFKASKICYIPGVGVDVDRFQEQKADAEAKAKFRRYFQMPEHANILLSVGELSKRKNHQLMIAALAKLSSPNVYYMICGQGKLEHKLLMQAQKAGVAERVRIVGFQKEVEMFYQNADIFVLPSLQEGLPVALMEAMAAGMPCVVSDIRGSRELIDENGGGRFSFNEKDTKQLCKILRRLLSDRGLRERYGTYNQKRIVAYDIRFVNKQMRKIYQGIGLDQKLPDKNPYAKMCCQNKDRKRVQVLMSTYNGHRFIAQQVDSILTQQGVEVSLLIRDDGSSDATWELLQQYAAAHENIRIYAGKNIGTQKSYFDLLAHADIQIEYFAFSDQDDVWHPCKLYRALEALSQEPRGIPLLYAGRVFYASEDLQIRKKAGCKLKRKPSFGNALVENICMGCTEVFNRNLLEIVKNRPPESRILHDWRLYMTASCFGKVVFDEHAYMLYRQHGQNQVGMQDARVKQWAGRILRLRKLRGTITEQANDFAYGYQDIVGNNQALELVAGYRSNWKKRLSIIKSCRIYRQNRTDQWIYKLLFGIGYL